MKEFYVAPEAEIVRFVAEENIAAEGDSYMFIGIGGSNGTADGKVDKYETWFGQ